MRRLSRTITIYSGQDWTNVARLRCEDTTTNTIEWSPNGQFLATAGRDQIVRIWSPEDYTLLRTLKLHTRPVRTVNWSNDSQRILSGSDDLSIVESRAWPQLQEKLALQGSDPTSHAAWCQQTAKLVFIGSDKRPRIWRMESQTVETAEENLHQFPITALAVHSQGTWFATGDQKGQVTIWETATLQPVFLFHQSFVTRLAWHPDECKVLVSGLDKSVRLYNGRTGENIWTYDNERDGMDNVFGLAWSPNGRQIAVAGEPDRINIVDAKTRENLCDLRGHSGPVYDVQWSPDGRFLASAAADGQLGLWDVLNKQNIRMLAGHGAPVRGVAWSADGKRVVSVSDDGTSRIRDTANGEQLLVLTDDKRQPLQKIDWHPEGHLTMTSRNRVTLLSPSLRIKRTKLEPGPRVRPTKLK